MRARKARAADMKPIHALILRYAEGGMLLPRTLENIREHIGNFLVLEEKGLVAGCVALESYGADLAEIRSLAVNESARGRGNGARLLNFALAEARRRKIARVFAVTHAPEFFLRHGFAASSRAAVPEKVARDCSICAKAAHCELVTVMATLIPERIALPVLNSSLAAASA